jgi:hypothetical protein
MNFYGPFFALNSALLLGCVIYGTRRWFMRDPDHMKRFLARRYDVIRRQGNFRVEEREYIDDEMIRSWGWRGLLFLPLAAMCLSSDQILHLHALSLVGLLASICLICFAGILLGDSHAARYFLKRLGRDRYKPDVHERI